MHSEHSIVVGNFAPSAVLGAGLPTNRRRPTGMLREGLRLERFNQQPLSAPSAYSAAIIYHL